MRRNITVHSSRVHTAHQTKTCYFLEISVWVRTLFCYFRYSLKKIMKYRYNIIIIQNSYKSFFLSNPWFCILNCLIRKQCCGLCIPVVRVGQGRICCVWGVSGPGGRRPGRTWGSAHRLGRPRKRCALAARHSRRAGWGADPSHPTSLGRQTEPGGQYHHPLYQPAASKTFNMVPVSYRL